MSVWRRITGLRGSGPPNEVEPAKSSEVGPEGTEAGQPPDDRLETVESGQPVSDGSEPRELDGRPDSSPEPTDQDEPPDAGPESAEQDEPQDEGLEPAGQDEPSHDTSPELPDQDEPPDAGPESAEQDEPQDEGLEPAGQDEPSHDTSPELPDQYGTPDAGPESAEQDEPRDEGLEPAGQDEPSHDTSPEPPDQDEPQDEGLEPNEPTGPSLRRKGAPRRHGGRRGSRSRPSEPSGNGPRTFATKSELICRKPVGSWQWDVILYVPQERKVERVRQGDRELSAKNHEYCPLSFYGSIVIEYEDRNGDEIQLFDNAPLVFKLPNQWHGDGRRVRGVTRGHFVVIAPRHWTRNGHVPVAPEGCVDDDFTAHFFYMGQSDEPDDVGGFEEHTLFLARSGYALEGQRVHDDSEEGDLFVGAAPVLKPADGIAWVRVGEEAHNGWDGQNFRPAEESLRDVLGRRQGRFFVRVYDKSAEMLDSGEFRYCADLHEIRVNGESYSRDMLLVPSHSPTTLHFIGNPGATIQPKLQVDNPHVEVGPDGTASLGRHPECDETRWSLGPGSSVDVVIRLPRIWWRIVRPNAAPGDWCDRAIRMSRDEYRDQSHAEAEIEIRVPSSFRNVHAGFGSGKDLDQSFRAERTERGLHQVSLPLDAFVEYEEIEEPSTRNVSLRMRYDGDDIALIHVTPEAPPPRPESLRDQTKTTGPEARWDPERRQGTASTKKAKESEESRETAHSTENPVLELPQVPKEPLVVKNPQRRYDLDIARRSAELFTLVVRTKCPEHQLTENDCSDSHTSVGKHIKDVRECCASTANYLASGRLLKDAVFRVVLSEYDRPLTARQISDELSKRWPTSELDLSPRVIERILDDDPNYVPVIRKRRRRRKRRSYGYHSRRGSSQRT